MGKRDTCDLASISVMRSQFHPHAQIAHLRCCGFTSNLEGTIGAPGDQEISTRRFRDINCLSVRRCFDRFERALLFKLAEVEQPSVGALGADQELIRGVGLRPRHF